MSFVLKTAFFAAALLCSFYLENARAEQINLLKYQTDVKDQERRDTCAYFAISALVESTFKKQTGEDYNVSEEFEIFRNKIINAWRPEVEFGDTYTVMKNIADDLYLYEENELPYQKESIDFTKPLTADQENFFDVRKKNLPKVTYRSLKFKMLSQMWVQRPWSEHIVNELKQERPVVVTIKVSIPHIDDTKGTFTFSPEINAQCDAGTIRCGGHAVLIVGYDDVRKVFMFKNSWGPKWGNNGYGYMTFAHVDQYVDQPITAYFDKLTGPSVKRVQP
ncbi:MAG: C1 family peptidase [Bdellovibrio sp.]|nr:C1 family peptidase [Bdellovibrio sp.]